MFGAGKIMLTSSARRLQILPAPITETAAGTDLVLTKPAGTVAGDLLVSMAVKSGDAGSWAPGAGFTELIEFRAGEVATLIAGASEPSSYTFSASGAGASPTAGVLLRIPGGTYDTIGAATASGSSTPVAPSITMSAAGLLLAMFYARDAATFTTPSGMFPILAYATGPSFALFGQYRSAGATGTRTSTSSSSNSLGVLLSVKPA